MSRMNNTNKKSTRRPLTNLEAQFLDQMMAKNQVKVPKKRNKVRKQQKQSLPLNVRGDMSRAVVSAQTKVLRTARPRMMTARNGDCRIVHREYITDLEAGANSPSSFSLEAIAINPGQSSTFQWLSRIAKNFESYRFEKLHFCYETEAPSSLGGTLLLAIDYDSADPPPTSKQQAMTYRESVRSAPWTPCKHISLAEDLNKQKSYFVRGGVQPANTDIRLYDVGNLFAISQGVTTAHAIMGELYVEYDVLLMTPIYEPIVPDVVGGRVTGNTSVSVANPLGTAPILSAGSAGFIVNNASRVTFLEAGEFIITSDQMGTGTTGMIPTIASGVVTFLQVFGFSITNATGTETWDSWFFNCAGPGCEIDLTTGDTTTTSCVLAISQVPVGTL